MKKFGVYMVILIASVVLSVSLYAENAAKDSLKQKVDVNLSSDVVNKLSQQELVDIIKNRDELEHEKEIKAMKQEDPPVPILIVVFGSFVLLMAIPYYFGMRKTKSMHALINSLIEKGHDIPRELIFPAKRKTSFRNDFQKGIILITLGLSISLVLLFVKVQDNYWTIGLIPVFVGVGFMISHKFGVSNNNKTENI